jgi:hypothetical protein
MVENASTLKSSIRSTTDLVLVPKLNNFKLASSKFAAREPHLFVKDVPWFKEWYKTNKEIYVIDN